MFFFGIYSINSVNELSDSKTRKVKDKVEDSSSGSAPILTFPPGIQGTIINIGSNVDPILPRKQDGPCVMAIAFEPIVPNLIKEHPRLQVIPAAISASPGLSTMTYMNEKGASSSLSEPASSQYWNNNSNRDGAQKFVPTLSFLNVLDSIPVNIKILFLMTDMQGHDFSALKASGDAMARRRIPRVVTEVWFDDISTYQGTYNDLCRDWLPFMTTIGYELVFLDVDPFNTADSSHNAHLVRKKCDDQLALNPARPPYKAGLKEANAYWMLNSYSFNEANFIDSYKYDSQQKFLFKPEEYASCQSSRRY